MNTSIRIGYWVYWIISSRTDRVCKIIHILILFLRGPDFKKLGVLDVLTDQLVKLPLLFD